MLRRTSDCRLCRLRYTYDQMNGSLCLGCYAAMKEAMEIIEGRKSKEKPIKKIPVIKRIRMARRLQKGA